MAGIILLILLFLWLVGYITIPGLTIPHFAVFFVRGRPITLWDVLVFLVILWAVSIVPSPLRQIGYLLVILWLLSALGLLAFGGALPHLIILAVVIGLLFSFAL